MLGHSHVILGWTGVILVESVARSSGGSVFGASITPLDASPVPIPGLALVLVATALGSLLPDLDHPRGALGNYRLAGIPFFKPASLVTSAILPHRGPTHSLFVWALLTALGAYLGAISGFLPLVWAGSLGYLAHLAADSVTKSGVPLLWPIWGKPLGLPPVRALRIHTGGWVEHALVLLALAFGLAVSTGILHLP